MALVRRPQEAEVPTRSQWYETDQRSSIESQEDAMTHESYHTVACRRGPDCLRDRGFVPVVQSPCHCAWEYGTGERLMSCGRALSQVHNYPHPLPSHSEALMFKIAVTTQMIAEVRRLTSTLNDVVQALRSEAGLPCVCEKSTAGKEEELCSPCLARTVFRESERK